ncbi:MAG: hypothetical protein EPO21_05790 [Chloroflexota bacterium]|nr:MAG: hypothetical protein EPO21_05790 [Chloroflexota bacterium]
MSFRWLPYHCTDRLPANYHDSTLPRPASRRTIKRPAYYAVRVADAGAMGHEVLVDRALLVALVLAIGITLLSARLNSDLANVHQSLRQANADLAGLLATAQSMETLLESARASAVQPVPPAAAALQTDDQIESAGSEQPQLSRQELEEIVSGAAEQYGLPFSWLAAQVAVESSWDPTKISPTSDYGLAQIHLSAHSITREQALDPKFAADWMASVMADYFRRYGTFREALRRYQCGEEGARYFDCGAGYAQKVLSLIPD